MTEIQYDYELVILGSPKSQGRPRARNAGKFVQIYDDPKSRKAKQGIIEIIQAKAPTKPLDCPLQLDLNFYLSRPKGHYRTGRNSGNLKSSAPLLHISRPDIDNLLKLVMDAMTGVFWRDDSLVCKGTTIKQYSERPRTEIYIKILKRS